MQKKLKGWQIALLIIFRRYNLSHCQMYQKEKALRGARGGAEAELGAYRVRNGEGQSLSY